MENQVQLFESEEFGRIRVVEIDGQPWFVAKDVCDVFGETNRNRAMQSLDDDEKGYTQTNTPGGQQQIAIVNESGLYSLLFVMKPSKARGVSKDYIIERETKLKDFRRWVTHKVLPSIRQHGTYITDAVLDEMTRSREFADNLLHRLQSERHKTAAMREYIDELVPKAWYYDVILQSGNAIQVSIIAKDYGMSAVAFNRLLHGLKIQYRVGDTWVLYQKYAGKGYTKSRTYYTASGCCVIHTYWTYRGRFFLYETLKALGILPLIESSRG